MKRMPEGTRSAGISYPYLARARASTRRTDRSRQVAVLLRERAETLVA
jgi:hypothetical protein